MQLFQLLPLVPIVIGLYCCRNFIWSEYLKEKQIMKHINRLCLLLVVVILLFISGSVIRGAEASGYFPEPVYTTDPNGNLEPEVMFDVACEIFDEHVMFEYPIEGNDYLIAVDDYSRDRYYLYYFYVQDLIDICMVMRSI